MNNDDSNQEIRNIYYNDDLYIDIISVQYIYTEDFEYIKDDMYGINGILIQNKKINSI